MSDWLAPLSRHTRFVDRTGRPVTTQFDVVRAAALDGRLASVATDVRGALADVQPDDTVWIFWPERDLGVVAVGKARPHRPRGGEAPELIVALDRNRTRTLFLDPIPAPLVTRWLTDVRGGARLDSRPRALEAVRAWEHDRAERDEVLLRALGVASWRTRAGRGGRGRPADDPVLASIVPFLRSQDFAVGVTTRDGEPRLLARRSRDVLVVHGASAGGDPKHTDAYRAFGRVRAHRWAVERAHPELRLRARAWLAFPVRPRAELVAFLEDEGLLVTWLHRGGRHEPVEMSDRSRQRWFQQLGVR